MKNYLVKDYPVLKRVPTSRFGSPERFTEDSQEYDDEEEVIDPRSIKLMKVVQICNHLV
jgi:hypothetical protein